MQRKEDWAHEVSDANGREMKRGIKREKARQESRRNEHFLPCATPAERRTFYPLIWELDWLEELALSRKRRREGRMRKRIREKREE